ncbi:MAG: SAM-dependent methyltransferase, partial [Rhodospirillaceae bacterium]
MILIANEFLDALPVRQFEKDADGWKERYVGVDEKSRFQFMLREPSDAPNANLPPDVPAGTVFEWSPDIGSFVRSVASRLTEEPGAALFVDYGHRTSSAGETLQAVRRHKYHPVLGEPGEADLTAHVDFEEVSRVAKSAGASVLGPIEQGLWLKRLGIAARGALLTRGKTSELAKEIETGIRRLTEPDAMGALFKVLALTHPNLDKLEG